MASRSGLPKICIALGFTEPEKLAQHARREVEAGESFLEFRLDYLPNPEKGVSLIRKFVTEFPDCSILATCRRHQNHGRFNGSIEEEVRILENAADAGARAVDIEIESAESAGSRVEALRGRALLIVSYHNYTGTPPMEGIVRRMQAVPADGYKLVTTAKKPSDNYRVLSLSRPGPKAPLVLLAMGEIGFATRVLSPAFGGLFTYAAPISAEGTAAGQVCARQLRQLYRIDRFSRAAKIYGVIADPVRHSISPAVHNRAFQARRMDAVYLPFLVHPGQLKDFMSLALKLPIAGFSITIPHKQKIMRYLDTVDPLARRIGAVNTVCRRAGKWRGSNTDAQAVTVPLARHLKLNRSTVLLAGNGGAARSAVFALGDAGAKVSLVGRNPDRVRALAKVSGAEPLTMEQCLHRNFDAVVHATPVGMYPHTNECFFPSRIPGEIVFDMVYNPLETVLLRRAAAEGKTTIQGIQMFVEQAVHQFEAWSAASAPRAVMEKAALEALSTQFKQQHA